jgi:hypothetical protein
MIMSESRFDVVENSRPLLNGSEATPNATLAICIIHHGSAPGNRRTQASRLQAIWSSFSSATKFRFGRRQCEKNENDHRRTARTATKNVSPSED